MTWIPPCYHNSYVGKKFQLRVLCFSPFCLLCVHNKFMLFVQWKTCLISMIIKINKKNDLITSSCLLLIHYYSPSFSTRWLGMIVCGLLLDTIWSKVEVTSGSQVMEPTSAGKPPLLCPQENKEARVCSTSQDVNQSSSQPTWIFLTCSASSVLYDATIRASYITEGIK